MSYGSNAIGQCGGCGEEANTADCGSVMRGFEPHHSPHFFTQKREREMSRAYTDGGKPPYGGIAKW